MAPSVKQTNSALANRLVLQGFPPSFVSFASPLPDTNGPANATPLVMSAESPSGAGLHGRGMMQLNAVLSSGPLLNVNFNAATGDRVGFAATGLTGSDVWNGYSAYGYSDVTLTDLLWSDGTSSGVGLRVQNAPAIGTLATGDGMYDTYVAKNGGPITITFTNLPEGLYDVFLYGHGAADAECGDFALVSGAVDYGAQAVTAIGSLSWHSTNWLDGVQYALFGGVTVTSNQPVVITIHPASDGYAVLNGLQIAPHQTNSVTSLVNVDFGEPGGSTNGMGAVGLSGSDDWNLSNSKFNEGLATTGPLVWSDGLASPLMLGIQNAPGLWYNPTGNAAYDTYVYPWDAGNITFALTNLANGYYDFYLYGHGAADDQNSIFGLATGGVDYGLKATTTAGSDSWTSLVWTEGMQYVVFRGIPVTTNDPVTITVYPDSSAYGPVALLNSLQVVLPAPSADTDSDGDGMPDWWEVQYGLNPHDPSDAAADPDEDGLTNLQEYQYGADPLNADGDGDGLPDAWEIKHFGNLAQTAEGDYDGDGVSNLDEFNSNHDPNTIGFSLVSANQYVASGLLVAQVRLQLGVPASVAVLVDSTNFDTATWNAYSSTNITVAVGSVEGWHDIWIGLRGRPEDSQQEWSWYRAKVDTTAPAVSLAGPANLVSQRLVQLTGFCPESLDTITYDLVNSAGSLSNQPIQVLDRALNTNTWEFGTNLLQAFDVELSPGENAFTIHATDLAGNVGTTNFSITLTNDTTPPALSIGWPLEDAQLSGSTFTLVGNVDDPGATITAAFVDANGAPASANGLVERDGKFWFEDLPLNAGANQITLTATDDWGNISTSILNVTQAPMVVTVDPMDPNRLYYPTMDLTGTISDPTYSVWVNGVEGVNNMDGTWSALAVPVNAGGTAIFTVSAYPPEDIVTANVEHPSENPIDANAVNALTEIDKPARLYVESYSSSHSGSITTHVIVTDFDCVYNGDSAVCSAPGDWGLHTHTESSQVVWRDGLGGFWTSKFDDSYSGYYQLPVPTAYSSSDECTDDCFWPGPVFWPDLTVAPVDVGGDCAGIDPPYSIAPPIMTRHLVGKHSQKVVYQEKVDVRTVNGSSTATTFAKMKFNTGGKATAQSQSLWEFSASATAYQLPNSGPIYASEGLLWEGDGMVLGPIPSTSIVLGDLGPLGSDGIIWRVLPNYTTVDVTPNVKGNDFYDFGVAQPVKHILNLAANGKNLDPDLDVQGPEFCVGQKVTMQATWYPELPSDTISRWHWSIDGDYVNTNRPSLFPGASSDYDWDPEIDKLNPTIIWWYDRSGGGENVNCHATENFANGQSIEMVGHGRVRNVFRPAIVGFNDHPPAFPMNSVSLPDGTPYLSLGDDLPQGNMMFTITIDSIYRGRADITQLINRTAINGSLSSDYSTHGSFYLDNYRFIVVGSSNPDMPHNVYANVSMSLNFADSPRIQRVATALGGYTTSVNDQFVDYVMFRPDAGIPSDNIYVCLGKITSPASNVSWAWSASTTWSLTSGWSTPVGTVTRPSGYDDSNDFPTWPRTLGNND